MVHAPWRDGGRIPKQYTCDGRDMTPVVGTLTHVAGARSFAVTMVDKDAPGGTFVHWTRWGATQGKNSFGRMGYSGPCPPKGDKPHHYVLTEYALPKQLALAAGAKPDEALSAIRSAAIATGSTTGLYSR